MEDRPTGGDGRSGSSEALAATGGAPLTVMRSSARFWSSRPLPRWLPDAIEVHVINSAGMPFLGTAECAQGPTAAALANALADAVGVRLREMPLSPERVKAAIGVI